MTKESLYAAGVSRAVQFCSLNAIRFPRIIRLARTDRLYHLATCAFYRPETISIMVEKCASPGLGGPAWSWPGYAVDRTPYGVIQHELGHHVDEVRSTKPLKQKEDLFSYRIHQASMEEPLTSYLGTDGETQTFFKEWFAEIFRLYVTNPDLCRKLRPRFCHAMTTEGLQPIESGPWIDVLRNHHAPARITDQASRKVIAAIPEPKLLPC